MRKELNLFANGMGLVNSIIIVVLFTKCLINGGQLGIDINNYNEMIPEIIVCYLVMIFIFCIIIINIGGLKNDRHI